MMRIKAEHSLLSYEGSNGSLIVIDCGLVDRCLSNNGKLYIELDNLTVSIDFSEHHVDMQKVVSSLAQFTRWAPLNHDTVDWAECRLRSYESAGASFRKLFPVLRVGQQVPRINNGALEFGSERISFSDLYAAAQNGSELELGEGTSVQAAVALLCLACEAIQVDQACINLRERLAAFRQLG